MKGLPARQTEQERVKREVVLVPRFAKEFCPQWQVIRLSKAGLRISYHFHISNTVRVLGKKKNYDRIFEK